MLGFKRLTVSPAPALDRLTHYIDAQYQDIMLFTSLYDEHALLFFFIALILLTAMIGAIVLASSSLDPSILLLPLLDETTFGAVAFLPLKRGNYYLLTLL